ncbi:uncharacterized protein DFL_008010 [Arthrobotrys flagrans]|uniref:Uncharacterized protein n=1 Tax=Arthrobotrys flagrans TaxID=97331 RepID=A0A436ZXC0_ARTFL|nr:hypothetical protein DFL_008010 [Arthrobotrys flagrans]
MTGNGNISSTASSKGWTTNAGVSGALVGEVTNVVGVGMVVEATDECGVDVVGVFLEYIVDNTSDVGAFDASIEVTIGETTGIEDVGASVEATIDAVGSAARDVSSSAAGFGFMSA